MKFDLRFVAMMTLAVACRLSAATPSSAPSTLEQQIKAAESELAEDEKELQEIKDVVTKAKPKEAPRENPQEGPKPRAAVVPAAVPEPIKAQAIVELQTAQAKVEFARQTLARAKAAPNEAAAQVEVRDALIKADEARNWMRRAESAFRPPEPVGANPPAGRTQGGGMKFASKTYEELARMSGKTSGFDSAGKREVQFSDPRSYDPDAKVLVTADGRAIPVAPLDNAFRQVVPAAKNTPLFVPAPTADNRPAMRLNPAVAKAISTPQAQAELRKVGGVALDVTIDLLNYAGVPDFRCRGAAVVENPVLISLGALAEKVREYTATGKSLDDLPAELRYPGNIGRICGFVLDAGGQDVYLIGVPAENPNRRIDLDCITLALRCVWGEGSIPSVSLDPLPGRPGGMQYCRVYGVPYDSMPAKIMLEADYAMKRITIGQLDVGVPRFGELAKARATKKDYHGSRYWLSPMPLSAGEIRVSPTYRTVLFCSSVRSMTEAMDAAEHYIGRTDELAEQVAELFTQSYDVFEQSGAIAPEGVFARLHGLVDAVVAAKLLRDLGVSCPVIEKFSRLPVRRLVGAEAVPACYPGIQVEHAKVGGRTYSLVGGAVLRARATRRSLDQYQDTTSAALERAADAPARGDIARPVMMTVTLPRGVVDGRTRADYAIMNARQALRSGKADQACDRLEKLVADDPQNAEAWSLLGAALALTGKQDAANKAMLKAADLEPDDTLEMQAALARRSGKAVASGEQEGWKRRCLSDAYARMATDLVSERDAKSARNLADFAIALWDQNPAAYMARSDCWGETTSDESVRDRTRAIELYRTLLKSEYGEAHRRALAFALTQDIGPRLSLLEQKAQGAADERGNLIPGAAMNEVMKEMKTVVDEASEAKKLDESLGLAWTVEAQARAMYAKWQASLGWPGDASEARDLALETVKRFPDLPDAHFALAFVDSIHGIILAQSPIGRHELGKLPLRRESYEALGKAIELDPTYFVAYLLRATMNLAAGERDKALADYWKAKKLDPNINPMIEAMIRRALQLGPDEKIPEPPAEEETPATVVPKAPPFQLRLVADRAGDDTEPMGLPLRDKTAPPEMLNVRKEAVLDVSALRAARVVAGDVGTSIEIEFTEAGSKWLDEATQKNIDRRMAIVLGGRVLMAPIIRSRLVGPRIQITGSFTQQEATELVEAINEALKLRK